MVNWQQEIIDAFNQGKTIQFKNTGEEWHDFERQNQLDKPNINYGYKEQWRIKPTFDEEKEEILEKSGSYRLTPMMKDHIKQTVESAVSTPEEETLNKIKMVLSMGNEAQAIRLLEQYGEFKKERKYTNDVTDLDKAATAYIKTLPGINYRSLYDFATQNKEAFKKGAEWRAETSYSRTEMLLFVGFCLGKRMKDPLISGSEMWEEWLQKFRVNGN